MLTDRKAARARVDQLAAADSPNRLDPAVLQAMLLPSRAHITRSR
jgi:hypothetical protein